jgi:hypothetical protein
MVKKLFFNEFFIKSLHIFCFIIISKVLFIDVFPAWYDVFSAFFSGKLNDYDVLFGVNDGAVSIHSKLITLSFVLMIVVLIKRNLSLVGFTVALIISFELDLYEFLDQSVHPFLMNLGVFDSFKRPGINEVNPQYTRLFLFVSVAIVLFVTSCWKKTRTLDRSFVTIISWSVIITSFLFHMAIPMSMLKYAKNDRMSSFVEQIVELPSNYFCKNKTCLFFDKSFNEKKELFVGDKELAKQFSGFIDWSKEFYSLPENRQQRLHGNSGNFVGVISIFHACIYTDVGEMLCAIDDNSMKNYGRLAQLWFAFLTSMAHGIWIFVGVLLLSLHKSRKIKYLVGERNKMVKSVSHVQ